MAPARMAWLLGAGVVSALVVVGTPEWHEAAAAAPPSGVQPRFSLDDVVYTPVYGQFALSPDGTQAVYTSVGNRYFSHPVVPNSGREGNLRLVSLATGEQALLTNGTRPKTAPRFSPDGRRVSFESEGDVWSVETGTGAIRRLNTDQAADEEAAWSPDGRSIAFVSGRPGWSGPTQKLPLLGRGSRVWVMSATGESDGLRQLTRDAIGAQDLSWSPTGDRILFSAAGKHYFSRQIWVVPADGGAPTRLTPDDETWNTMPRWSPDGARIAFISDRSGFRSLWVMDADGQAARRLLHLDQDQDFSHNEYLQTKTLAWSPDGASLLSFAIRAGNIDLHVVRVADGADQRLNALDGQHLPVGWVNASTIAFTREAHDAPPALFVQTLGQSPRRVNTHPRPAVFQAGHLEKMERVSLAAPDGLRLEGFLHTPSWQRPGQRLPAIVFCHTYCPGQNYNEWNAFFSYLAESGYVLLRLDHRGSTGYGRAFAESARLEHGRKVPEDIAAGARFLQELASVDAKKVGVMGYSFGGSLVTFGLAQYPDLFRAGVSSFGTVDRRGQRRASWAYYLGGYEEEHPERYVQASPITHVARIKAPLLLLGGEEDTIVDTTQTYRYVEALRREGKYFELFMYPGEQHGLRELPHQLDSYRQTVRFLDQFLR